MTREFTDMAYLASSEPGFAQVLWLLFSKVSNRAWQRLQVLLAKSAFLCEGGRSGETQTAVFSRSEKREKKNGGGGEKKRRMR